VNPDAEPRQDGIPAVQRGFERMLAASRLLVLIPVVVLLLTALGTFVYGADTFVRSIDVFFGETGHAGARLGLFLIVLDVFLAGVTLLITAIGLYELFIIKGAPENGDDGVDQARAGLPAWLQMRDLDDLKTRIFSMLIMVATITFVDQLVETHNETTAFYMGLGVAVVVVALTIFLRFGRDRP
jgi:uncharacterized membrane protein YqhA